MSSARIANVAGALVPGGAGESCPPRAKGASDDEPAPVGWAAMLSSLFVSVVGRPAAAGEPSLAAIEAALREAACDRVLVADPRAPVVELEVLLAMVAWPEAGALVYHDEAGDRRCALYRTRDALARIAEANVGDGVDGLLATLDAQPLDRAALGLAEARDSPPPVREAC